MTRVTQVLALLLVALTMGLEFAHTLELGPKLNYPPELYLRLNTTLYVWFGPPLGAAINTGAIVVTGALVWLMRRQRPPLLLTSTAFALQVAQLANYFARVEPVNGRFRALAPRQVPGDFAALRAQWEYGHALGFVLFAVAFVLLVISLLGICPNSSWAVASLTSQGRGGHRPHFGGSVDVGGTSPPVAHGRELDPTDVPVEGKVGTVEFTTPTGHSRLMERRLCDGALDPDCRGGYRWHEGRGWSRR